jgi:hypothetical protein
MNRITRFRATLVSCLALGGLVATTSGCSGDSDPPAAPAGPSPAQTNPNQIPNTPIPPNGPPPDTASPLGDGADIGGFPSATKCEACHAEIYKEWTTSMHSHAAKSPVTVAQTNQAVAQEFQFEDDPDPQQFCTNCHGPIPALLTGSANLPFQDAKFSQTTLNEGITCVTCHKYDVNEVPVIGYAADTDFQKNFNASNYMFGPFRDPMKNAFHESAPSSLLADDDDSDALCSSCHQVGVDLNKNGQLLVGEDFVLQNTFQEYLAYEDQGGEETCVSCHMPARTGQAANLPGAPIRQIRSHIFLGVDYGLDEVADGIDDLKPAREQLLRSAGQIDIVNVQFANNILQSFDVTIENTGTGHNLPSAFQFMRQMWVEARVVDPTGRSDLFSSGVLRDPSNDLCDLNTLNDDGLLSNILVGCDDVQQQDDQLLNFQTKLLDRVDIVNGQVLPAAGSREHHLQLLTGGAVARTRGGNPNGEVLAPLNPFETRQYTYDLGALAVVAGSKIEVRLLYRNLPPYMVRKIGKDQPAGEAVQIEPLIRHLQVTEIDSREFTLQ